MHQINDVIVRDGQIVVSHLPFPDGQHVQVTVSEIARPAPKTSISQIRELLRGKVERFENPTDPMIPDESWEMNK